MRAIIEKELRSYFCTVRGYIFIGVFLLISGYFFITYNIISGNADVAVMLENTIVAFVLLIPVLTMSLFAGEKKAGTSSLYLSAPLAKWEIVLGKYIAATAVFLLAVAINSISAMVMIAFRGQTFGEVFSVYFGFALLGMAFISVGMLISALTENQVVSAIIGLCACFTLYMSDWLLGSVSNEFLRLLALPDYYSKFLLGIFDARAVIYFISFSAVFILLTILYLERIETKSGTRRGVLLIVACIIGSFLLVNYTATRLSKKVQMTWDMSQNGVFDLTQQTTKYLETLDEDVSIYYMAEESSENPYIEEVLMRYGRASKRIKLQNVDLIKNPSFAGRYIQDGKAVAKGSVVIESSKRYTIVEPESSFYVKRETSGALSRELGFSLESMITRGIDYCLSEDVVKAYWTINHGEDNYAMVLDAMRKENISAELTQDLGAVIDDTDLLVIFAPIQDITLQEEEIINSYLDRGGKLFMALDPGYNLPRLKAIAKRYQMTMEDTVLTVDNMSDIIHQNRMYLLTIPTRHPITEGMTGEKNLLFPIASPITLSSEGAFEVTNLAVTDSKTATRAITDDVLGERLSTGTFTVCAISENVENASKIILASSSQFLSPSDSNLSDVLESTSYSNKEFFIKGVKYLLNYKDKIMVAPKSLMSRSLTLTAGTKFVLAVIFGGIIPIAVFVLAFIIFRRRKHR